MSVSRIKSIVIGVLVIINLLFLTLIVADKVRENRTRVEELQRVTELFSKNGVVISPEVKLSDTPAARSGPRSTQAEAALAGRLLGEAEVSDQGGSIYLYTSDRGEALFRSGGELEIDLAPGALEGECSEAGVKKLLKSLGLTAREPAVGDGIARTVQTCQGLPIFNCELELRFDSGCLRSISGRLAADMGAETGGDGGMSCASALMRFLSLVISGEAECGHVYDISPGYVLNTSVFGDVALEPAWRILTDNGEYQLSAVSGVQIT